MKLIIDYDMKDSSIKIVRLTLRRSAIMPDWASRWLLMLRPLEALQPPTESLVKVMIMTMVENLHWRSWEGYLGVSPNSFATF